MGNGAKAAHKREKNTGKPAAKGEASQLKSNLAAQSIQCDTCKATFQGTSKQPLLQQHVDARHPKSNLATCFPKFVPTA